MKIQSKWIISFGVAMIVGLIFSNVSYGMENPNDRQKKELFECFENTLPKEVQQKIKNLMLKNAIDFLKFQPITIKKYTYGFYSMVVVGDKVVIASDDITARIVDINTGQFLHTLSTEIIFSIAADSDRVVIGLHGKIKVWDINTAQLLHTFIRPSDTPNSIIVTNDKVITASDNGNINIWDINTGQLLHTLTGQADIVLPIAVAGYKVVIASDYGTIKIWNINTVQLLHTLIGHTHAVYSIVVADDKIVTRSGDMTVKIWDIDTGQLLHTIVGGAICSMAVADNKVITGSGDMTAKIWDINTGQLLHTLIGHTNVVYSIAISGYKVATGSHDKTVKIWDINTGKLFRTLRGHTSYINSIAVVDDKVVTESDDETVKIWPLSPNLQGTPNNNPLVWIISNITLPQVDFIKRAYEATIAGQDLIISLPQKLGKIENHESSEQMDGRTYFSFPEHVREYLRNCLNIRKPAKPNTICVLQ